MYASILPACLILFLLEYGICGKSIYKNTEKNECDEYYRVSLREHPNYPNDCGTCFDGLVKDTNDKETKYFGCYKVDIIQIPLSISEYGEGEEIVLDCQFNHDVKCLWHKDGHKILIDDHTKYAFRNQLANENQETIDCTLLIKEASEEDSGDYECTCYGTSDYTAPKSNISQVTVFKGPQVVIQPAALINQAYSEAVTLNCQFDQAVRCNWHFKHKESSTFSSMNILKNLAYVDQSEEAKKDCSIQIARFSVAEEGDWLCQGKNERLNRTAKSIAARITGYKAIISAVNIYYNGSIMDGETISIKDLKDNQNLLCVLDHPSNTHPMIWSIKKRDGVKTEILNNDSEMSKKEIFSHMENVDYLAVQCQCGESKAMVMVTNSNTKIKEDGTGIWIAFGVVLALIALAVIIWLVYLFIRHKTNLRETTVSQNTKEKQGEAHNSLLEQEENKEVAI